MVFTLFTLGLLLLGWVGADALVSKTFSFSTADLSFSQIEGYDLVSLPDCDYMGDVGKPALPVMMLGFAIPTNNRVTGFTISGEETEEVSGSYLIFPAQELARTDGSPPPDFAPPDPSVYESSDPFPGILVELSNEGYFAGSKIATISIYPLQWIPPSGKLTLSTHFTITLELGLSEDWSQPVGIRTQDTHDKYIQMTKDLVENPEQVEGFANQPQIIDDSEFGDQGPYTCIIITPEAFTDQFIPLRDWNRRRGLRTQIYWVEWIDSTYSGYDSPEKIRNFIKWCWSNAGTEWVLLGGDADNVPVRNRHYGGIPADLYYGALDGTWDPNGNHLYGDYLECGYIDYKPEVWVGRAQVADQAEAELFVNKVLAYQQNPGTYGGSRDFLLMGAWADEDVSGGNIKNVIVSDLPPQDVTFWRMYDANYVPPPPMNEQIGRDAVKGRLQEGFCLNNHVGHGDYGCIAVNYDDQNWEWIYNADLDILSNDGHGTLYSIACNGAAFDKPSELCFGQHWLINPAGGGVAYLGESRFGRYDRWHPGTGASAVLDRLFTKFLYSYGSTSMHFRAIGRALGVAKNWLSCPSYTDYELCSLNLLGDPTMPVCWKQPLTLSVSHPTAIPAGFPIDFEVTVTDKFGPVQLAWVCLYKEGHIYELRCTDESGVVSFPLSLTSEQMGEMLVTVSRFSHIPYLGSCWITLGATLSDATALNNAKRFMLEEANIPGFPNEFDVLFVSDTPEKAYDSYSYDPKGIWTSEDIGSGKYGALSLARWPAVGHPILKAVWCDGDNLLYRSRYILPRWYDWMNTIFVEEPPLIGVSAPSFAIDTLTNPVSDIAYVAWQSVGYQGGPVLRKYYLGWFEPVLDPSGPDFQYVVFDELTSGPPSPEYTGPSIDIDPGPPSYRPYVHIAWEKNGEIFYTVSSSGGISPPAINISESPALPSEHACLDIHQSIVHVVWEEGGDILYRSIVGGVPGEIENVSESSHSRASVRPVVERAFVAWSEQQLGGDEIFLRRKGISGWTDIENLSNSPSAPSRHPQLLYRPRDLPSVIPDELYAMWTEGTQSPFCIRFEEREVPVENIRAYDLGQPDPSPVTVQRDSCISYGPWWPYETADYDSSTLVYHISGLLSEDSCKVEAVYYHEFDDPVLERIEIDGTIACDTLVPPNTPLRVTLDVPGSCLADSQVTITVRELSGDLAICSMLLLYESLGPGGGPPATRPFPALPGANALSQNFPNPVSDNTTIQYQLAGEAGVRLTVYDVAGRVVTELLDEKQHAGLHTVRWDSRDRLGCTVASGVYFYRLAAGDFTSTRKMVVLR